MWFGCQFTFGFSANYPLLHSFCTRYVQEVMSPSYADINKLVEDNYFHWEYNMRMKLSRKGLLAHIVKPEFDALSDRGTTE